MKFRKWKKMIVMLVIATMFLQNVVAYASEGDPAPAAETPAKEQTAAEEAPVAAEIPAPAETSSAAEETPPAPEETPAEEITTEKQTAAKAPSAEEKPPAVVETPVAVEAPDVTEEGTPELEEEKPVAAEETSAEEKVTPVIMETPAPVEETSAEEEESTAPDETPALAEESSELETILEEFHALLDQMEAFELTEENQEEYQALGMQAGELLGILMEDYYGYEGMEDDMLRFQVLGDKQTGGAEELMNLSGYEWIVQATVVDANGRWKSTNALPTKKFNGTTMHGTSYESIWKWTPNGNGYTITTTASTAANAFIYMAFPGNLWDTSNYTYLGMGKNSAQTQVQYDKYSSGPNYSDFWWTPSKFNSNRGVCINFIEKTGYICYIFQEKSTPITYTLNYNGNGGTPGRTKDEQTTTAASYTFSNFPYRNPYRLYV